MISRASASHKLRNIQVMQTKLSGKISESYSAYLGLQALLGRLNSTAGTQSSATLNDLLSSPSAKPTTMLDKLSDLYPRVLL